MSYFPPYSKNKIEVELDLSNYATHFDLKNTAGVDKTKFAKKDDLVNLKSGVEKSDIDKIEKVPSGLNNLKSKVDELDIDEFKNIQTDLSKLSNVIKNEVVKKTEYDELVRKNNAIDTSKLVNKSDYNAKVRDIENKIPNNINLATNAAFPAVEDKIR